ncbi:MAG: rod-binding protein [Magnetococcales bacterium]|nr:rod-binding protein [Magnetococcales bacterium]
MEGINTGITPASPLQSGKANGGLSAKDTLSLRKAAADFESMFVKQMLTSMRKAIPKEKGALIKESEGEKMFKDMLDTEYAKTASRSGNGLGLGAAMFKQLVSRYGQAQGVGTGNVPTVAQAKYEVDKLRSDASAIGAVGQGRVGGIGGAK